MTESRNGIKLLEAVVLIACAAVLLALLFLPTIGPSFSHIRRSSCASNLRSLAQATVNFETAHGHYPGYAQDFGTYVAALHPADSLDPNADVSRLASHRKIGTWAVAILPYIDQQAIYEIWSEDRYPIAFGGSEVSPLSTGASGLGFTANAAANVSTLRCPADVNDGNAKMALNSYACNAGMYVSVSAPHVSFAQSMSAANGVFGNQFPGLGTDGKPVAIGANVSSLDLNDGLTNTMLFAENAHALPWHRAGFVDARDLLLPSDGKEIVFDRSCRFTQGLVWHYEDDLRTSGAPKVKAIHRINGVPAGSTLKSFSMTRANAMDAARPSSFHRDGFNAGMADGSTRFIADSIDYRVYQALLTPCGAISDVPDPSFVATEEAEK